jgi:glycosyltransferase involved in cell wall biosynthesis
MREAIVTVAIPYYREGIEYFSCAVKSLMNQTFEGWRGIVIDDSPDGEPKLESVIARSGKRIGCARNEEPHGIGNAWNTCLEAAETELVCILHSDDEYEPAYLSRMTELAIRFPEASMYFCGATIIDDLGHDTFSLPDFVKELIRPPTDPIIVEGEAGISRLMVGNYIMCPTLMYRRSRTGGRRFSRTHRFVLDLRFTVGALFDDEKIVGTSTRLYRYRRHPQQATKVLSTDGLRFEEELALFRDVQKLSCDRDWCRAARAAKLRPTYRLNAALSGRLKAAVT